MHPSDKVEMTSMASLGVNKNFGDYASRPPTIAPEKDSSQAQLLLKTLDGRATLSAAG